MPRTIVVRVQSAIYDHWFRMNLGRDPEQNMMLLSDKWFLMVNKCSQVAGLKKIVPEGKLTIADGNVTTQVPIDACVGAKWLNIAYREVVLYLNEDDD